MSRRGLVIGGRLDRYVGLLFLSSYATAFFVLVGLFLIIDLSGHLNTFLERWKDGSSAPISLTILYCLFSVPFVFLQVAPFVSLVGALFTTSRMLKHNEITAALAAGVSKQRLLLPIFVGGLLSGVGMMALRETATSILARKRDAVQYILSNQSYDEVYKDLWVRGLGGAVVHMNEFRPAAGPDRKPEVRGLVATVLTKSRWWKTTAMRAVYESREGRLGWWFDDGVCSQVVDDESHVPVDCLTEVDFTPELALTSYRAKSTPMDLSYREVRGLARRDPDNVVYATLLQHHVTFTLANLVLLLVGLPIVLQSSRGKPAERLVLGCVLCVFYFAFDFVLMNLGLQGGIDPPLAAWLPVIAFGSLGIVMFDSMES